MRVLYNLEPHSRNRLGALRQMTAPDSARHATGWRTPFLVITAACLIAMLCLGIRSSFGIYLEPMSSANEWGRGAFSLAMAIQYMVFGACVPIAGAIADKRGPGPILIFGAICYGLGIWGMAEAESVLALYLFGGVVAGIGVAFTSFSITVAAIARMVSVEQRSVALGLGTAAGSLGQVLFSPLGVVLIEKSGWHTALLWLAGFALLIIPLALIMPSRKQVPADAGELKLGIKEALWEAGHHRGYVLLTTGFFVCGFHVAFITVHFPAYIADLGLMPSVGGYAIALIGLMNILGSLLSGLAGKHFSKKRGLSTIYFCRALAIFALLMAPKTEFTLLAFAATMGLLWLSTVPLTSGIVAQIFGLQYLSMLFGFVLLSHQIGSFMGVWLGGWLHDATGSYDAIWWVAIALAIFATVIHLPIDEKPVARLIAAERTQA